MNSSFPQSNAPIKHYRFALSGHSHRVELMLSLLDLPVEPVDVDLVNGAHKTEEFLKISPFGKVPAIDDNGVILSDSNAILVYLAKTYGAGTSWLPEEPVAAAEVQRWLSVAAGEIASGPAAARIAKVFGVPLDHPAAVTKAHMLFEVMEDVLSTKTYLTGDKITIADVAGYSYIAHAPEGGVSLADYPKIRAWLERIEVQPNFTGMPKSPIPDAA